MIVVRDRVLGYCIVMRNRDLWSGMVWSELGLMSGVRGVEYAGFNEW